MCRMRIVVSGVLLCLFFETGLLLATTMDVREPFFESQVRPLLAIHCYQCHGPDVQEAGLRLDSGEFVTQGSEKGPVLVPEKPDESPLIHAVRHQGEIKMPPTGPLRPEQIEVLVEWVRLGAFWPKSKVEVVKRAAEPGGALFSAEEKAFWAFQSMDHPRLPDVKQTDWSQVPFDRFILAAQESSGIGPAREAGRPKFLRRIHFDLTGLPPTPEEIEAFVTDPSPHAQVKVVDRLLASPRYGERWGRNWLDVVRFAESAAHDGNNAYINAWRYRDYVISALNRDLPYDQFVIEQLAGDLLPKTGDVATDLDRVVATGFLQVGPKPVVMRNKHQMLREIADEQIHATGVVFMGLTIGCARCHDHKFDPIPTADYYSLAGIFLSTNMMQDFLADSKWIEYMVPAPGGGEVKVMGVQDQATPRDVRIHIRGNYEQLGEVAPRRFLRIISGEDQPPIETTGSGRLELARWIGGDEHPLTARVMVNRIWQWHFGTGLVASSGDFGIRGEKPSHPELLDWLARRFIDSGWSIKAMHRRVLLSSTYQQAHVENSLAARVDPHNRLLWRMSRRRLTGEEIRDTLLALGDSLDSIMGGSDFNYKAIQAGGDADRELYALGSRPDFPLPRRSVYLPVVRNFRPEIMRLFDAANEHESTSLRHETTVAPQSLFFLNSKMVREQALKLAQKLTPDLSLDEMDAGQAIDDQTVVRQAYQMLLGRSPRNVELAEGIKFLNGYLATYDPDGIKQKEIQKSFEQWRKRLAETPIEKKLVPHDYLIRHTKDLMVYYRFDESAGAKVGVNEVAPGKYDAQFQEGVSLGVLGADDVVSADGSVNTSLELDGSGPHVRVTDETLFHDKSEAMTVEYWIRPMKMVDAMVVGRDRNKNGQRLWKSGVIRQQVNGMQKLVVYYQFFGVPGEFRTEADSRFVAEIGQWTHVAFTFGSGERRLYVNGILVDKMRVGRNFSNGVVPLTIGATADGMENFNGNIDEVAIYNRDLDQATIESHYQGAANLSRPVFPVTPYRQALQSFCQALMCLNEFVYVE